MKKENKGTLGFLYGTAVGRVFLKLLSARWLSRIAGAFCSSRLSKPLIRGFVKKNGIDLAEYEDCAFSCFNDCFTRKIKPELRPICTDKSALISPCDGLLSAYPITDGLVFPAKQSEYSVAQLLNDAELAKEFDGGYLLVFRLCVTHYHRYCYVDSGTKGKNIFIKGKLHTVRPVALENRRVFIENCREYTVMETENLGSVIQCEVGAMLVGKIKNHHGEGDIIRGEEKGMFLYGGSTVILIVKKDTAALPSELLEATARSEEIPVKYGEKIADCKQ